MARAGYCSHGWHIPTKTNTEPVKITRPDGTEVEIPPIVVECPYCASEKRRRKDQAEYQQAADMALVKNNLLRLLKEDPDFAEEVRQLLHVVVKNTSRPAFTDGAEKRCCS